jgi:nicotinamidase-related amidase
MVEYLFIDINCEVQIMNILQYGIGALILIDFQQGFDDVVYWGGQRNNPDAEKNASLLLNFWREHSLPVFHIKHCSANPDSRLAEGNQGNEFKALVRPAKGETVIRKNVNSAFIGTGLKQQLDDLGIRQLVIVGLTTDHCVSTTARMAGNYGFNTYVVYDATATFNKTGFNGENYSAELIHDTALASLNGEFATLVRTADLIF